MDELTQTASQSNEVPSQTSEVASTTPVESPTLETDSSIGTEPQAPAFTPNFKVKVLNKEYDIPENFRTIVKTPDDEKSVREIFEKAYGLDHVKSERERYKEELKSIRPQYETYAKTVDHLKGFYQKNDMESFFELLGVQKGKIFEWAVNEAKRMELPPEQQQVYNERQAAQRQAYLAEQQMRTYEEQLKSIQTQTRESELQYAVSQPEVAQLVQSFDQRNGEGSFRDEVIARGQFYWQRFGKDVPAQAIVQEIAQKYFGGTSQQPQPMAQTPQVVPTKPAVIPNVSGHSSSPAQRKISSIDDLKRAYTEKFR